MTSALPLTDSSGSSNVTRGSNMILSRSTRDAAQNGNELYRELHLGIVQTEGLYELAIGDGIPLAGSFDTALFASPERNSQAAATQALRP